jgi:hypothetical protein
VGIERGGTAGGQQLGVAHFKRLDWIRRDNALLDECVRRVDQHIRAQSCRTSRSREVWLVSVGREVKERHARQHFRRQRKA